MRLSILLALSIAVSGAAVAAPQISGGTALPADRLVALSGEKILDAACCKTCRKGQACGDSCISKSKSCSKGVGCACNAN